MIPIFLPKAHDIRKENAENGNTHTPAITEAFINILRL